MCKNLKLTSLFKTQVTELISTRIILFKLRKSIILAIFISRHFYCLRAKGTAIPNLINFGDYRFRTR